MEERSIAAPSNDIVVFSNPVILSVGKIPVRFIFLLNWFGNLSGNKTLYPTNLKETSHSLGPIDVIGSIKSDGNRSRDFSMIHVALVNLEANSGNN